MKNNAVTLTLSQIEEINSMTEIPVFEIDMINKTFKPINEQQIPFIIDKFKAEAI